MRRVDHRRAVIAALFALAAAACASAPSPGPAPIQPAREGAGAYLQCLREARAMMVSAHRGGPAPGYPENAIETFAQTLAVGPMLIEADVRRSADGVFVLLHDETLDRTTTGEGLIAERSVAELSGLRLRDNQGAVTPFRIPTLDEALAWARGQTILQLDVKRGAPIEEVARAVVAAEAWGYAVLIAYTEADALKATAVDPRIAVSVSVSEPAALDRLAAQGLEKTRIVAWTGTGEPRPALWAALDARDVGSSWGSLWGLDADVARTGDAAPLAALAGDGLDVLATDLPREAYAAIAARQDTQAAVATCNRAARR